jgi:hypothetical protein
VNLAKAGKPAKAAPRRIAREAQPPSLRRLLGKAAGLSVLMLLFLGVFGLGVRDLVYAAGWAGTAGTIQVVSCHDEGGSGDSSWVCSGVYHSSDGRTVDPDARVKPSSNEHGHTIDVRHKSGHDYSATGAYALAAPISLTVFGGLPVLGVLWGSRAALRRWVEDVRGARKRALRTAAGST